MFNNNFNNVKSLLIQSVIMKDDIGVPGETTDMPLTIDTLHHMKCIKYTMPWAVIELPNFVMVIDTDCISIYKSI